MHTSHRVTGTPFCSLRQWGAAIIACLLMTTVANADCDKLTVASFKQVKNRTDEARTLQHAVNAAYTDLDAASMRLLSDGVIGPQTVRQFVRFCKDINLTASQDLPGKLIEALNAFDEIVKQKPQWKKEVSDVPFKNWTTTLCDGTYGEFFTYSHAAPLVPGGAFLLANYQSREQTVTQSKSLSANGLFVLEESDLEILKTIGSLEGLLEVEPTTKTALRDELIAKLAADHQSLDALVEPLLNDAACATNYRLNKQTVAKLTVAGLPQQLRADVAALGELNFESEQELNDKIDALTGKLATDYLATIAGVEATTAPPPAAAPAPVTTDPDGDSAKTASDTDAKTAQPVAQAKPNIQVQRAALLADGLPTELVNRFPFERSNNRTVEAFVGQYGKQIKKNLESINVYSVTEYTLKNPSVQGFNKPIPIAVLEGLEPLKGVRFPNGDLFRTAVRLSTGLGSADALAMNTILRVARDQSDNKLELDPIRWAAGDCGCGVFESLDTDFPTYLYGIYPYWQAPQKGNGSNERVPEIVDFSMLDRIGYYGVTFDSTGKIVQPLHFQQKKDQSKYGWFQKRRNFADFIKRAHQYKTKVDLVVYNSQWQHWLPKDGVEPDDGMEDDDEPCDEMKDGDEADKLIASIVSTITKRLDGTLNDIKPIISLNASPARTLGDGVTFDFDFAQQQTVAVSGQSRRVLELKEQQLLSKKLGEKFFKELKRCLNPYSVPYFINVIVPGECLLAGADSAPHCSYYSLDNLQKIETHVDLLLVDFSARMPGSDVLGEMKKVRERIETETPDTETDIRILKKLVPLVSLPLHDDELDMARRNAIKSQILYANWNFSGFAGWQVNYHPDIKEDLRNIIIGRPADNVLAKVETAVCNVACPNRWPLRTFIFVLVVVSGVYLIASYWLFGLRTLYGRRSFRIGVILVTALLIVTLWCDPYWSQRKSLIMFVALVGALGFWIVSERREGRRLNYP